MASASACLPIRISTRRGRTIEQLFDGEGVGPLTYPSSTRAEAANAAAPSSHLAAPRHASNQGWIPCPYGREMLNHLRSLTVVGGSPRRRWWPWCVRKHWGIFTIHTYGKLFLLSPDCIGHLYPPKQRFHASEAERHATLHTLRDVRGALPQLYRVDDEADDDGASAKLPWARPHPSIGVGSPTHEYAGPPGDRRRRSVGSVGATRLQPLLSSPVFLALTRGSGSTHGVHSHIG